MQYNAGAQLDPSQVEVRGGGNGGRVAIGGGVSIIVLILAMLFGINPSELMGGGGGTASQANPGTDLSQCQTGADVEKNRECRFVVYANTNNAYWSQVVGDQYTQTKTVLYSGQTPSGCGTATTDVGPFYCPADKAIYIDPSFTEDMLKGQLGGQGGDAAEAYVSGHEYGHHIQDLLGTLDQVQAAGQTTGENSPAVALELQADCYAGAYLAHVTQLQNSPISGITQDDLNRIVNAAQVVGDDYIQKASSGRVNPDAWTHGSSAMRQRWLAVGFKSGDPNQCSAAFGNVS